MAANIYIKAASIDPNPVGTGQRFLLSVDIRDCYTVLVDDDNVPLADADGALLEVSTGAIALADSDGIPLMDDDGKILETD